MVKKAAYATPNHLLRTARKERGWTQRQVADQIGAPLSLNVSRWENGTAFPSLYYLERLCQLFGKSAHELGLSQLEGEAQGEHVLCTEPSREQRTALKAQQHDETRSQTDARMGALPYPRNPFFLGREEALARLRHQWQAGQTMAFSQPQAITGLGGVGKTQVALEYAYRSARDYQAVFWMRADSRDALVDGFLEIASVLHLPERDEQDQSVVVAAVKGWFSQNTNWLLILDNADELALLPEFLPSPLSGHLLLTTRAQALGLLARRVEIETLDMDTAPLLLLRRAGLLALDAPLAQAEPSDWQAAVLLAQELGCLPLALDQAGAYLEETGCSLQQYLELHRSHRADLLRYHAGVVLDHPDSVATTWSLSFALIEQRSALAADLLRLCAILHPDAIPEEMFQQAATHLGSALAAIETDPLAFNQALAVIGSYSLMRRNAREHTLSIHRLVQAVLADAMTRQEREQWRRRAIAALHALFPDVRHQGWGQWEPCGRLLPHVLTIAASTAPQTHSLELSALLSRAADYLCQRAQYEQAEPLYQRALSIGKQTQGREHPQSAFPLTGLAGIYREQGRYAEAESLYRRALHLWEQAPAQEYAEMAALLNDLGILYLEQGDYQQAEPLLQRALHLNEQMLGKTHPDVAYPLTNLADLYREQGRYAEAEPLYQRALQIRDLALGGSHPQVAYPLAGLANLYREQGRYAEAEPFYQRALTIRYQQRGVQHPETAESLQDFARLQELQNQPDQALRLYQQALDIREQRLGPEHPRTVETRSCCAHLLRICGRLEEAAALETVPTKK
jgi:tetratricopeptide (TPR) repeat protein/transcriptional regulator with XRE-family HTH domain